ncbi:hypothetical protein L211DRAFT_843201 [Terfezia boudieri ATCC MYA-4762]|uniref:Uncharacterized protein n=1 Tax=Terfezia boudieri ATCC MYA-4762 TaxID=1051890 RepID=A0A3N4LLP2_9PEZI|nr:hypothetical protein L211DRAFT_843201 [Terfezia boudieri ATCC MYA-4762]
MPITSSNIYFHPSAFSKQPAILAQVVAVVIANAPENAHYAVVTPEDKWPPLTVDWYDANNEHLNQRRIA